MSSRRTWRAAARRWHSEGMHRASETIRRERTILDWVQPRLGRLELHQIHEARLLDLRGQALRDGWSARSVNYMTQTVGTVLRASVRWRWRRTAPPALKPLPLPPHRERWLTPIQAAVLLDSLPEPVKSMAALTLETGLRRGNITGLVWDWVDLEGRCLRIPGKYVKSRKPLTAPLTPVALEILRRRKSAAYGPYVFHRLGRPILQPNGRAWAGCLRRSEIEDFRWHDLRHTWA